MRVLHKEILSSVSEKGFLLKNLRYGKKHSMAQYEKDIIYHEGNAKRKTMVWRGYDRMLCCRYADDQHSRLSLVYYLLSMEVMNGLCFRV
ncbi:hypothetical protein BM1374166_02025 [Bartonella tribocorum]|nr:hypothetical protein BM1374166_02025 [Bartonella tribocorum]